MIVIMLRFIKHDNRHALTLIWRNDMTQASPSKSLGTAVVTGASAGLGRIYADRLARRGYDLLLVARRGDRLEAAAADIRAKHGVAVKTLVADLGNAADLDKVVATLASDTSITMVVNNAGTSTLAPIGATSQSQMLAMVGVNATAVAALSMAVLAGFKQRDHGTIVNIGSVLGFAAIPVSAVYSGTKAFVMHFTRSLQDELADTKVRVQLVLPAATATDIWELSGVPLSNLDAAVVMDADRCVDAALAGLDLGEQVTMPSVEDTSLLAPFDESRVKLLSTSQRGTPATRYAR
jgi:uncharacterized protein